MLREGYQIPFIKPPPLSLSSIVVSSYSQDSPRGQALAKEVSNFLLKGAIEPTTPFSRLLQSPIRCSECFGVMASCDRPFHIQHLREGHELSDGDRQVKSVLLSIRQNNWMVSINLKEAYLQIPIHQASRRYLRFVALQRVFQFKALCFGFSTAPQVFTRVMVPVSRILRQDPKVLRQFAESSTSLEECLRASDKTGIMLSTRHYSESREVSIVPKHIATYLGMVLNSQTYRASPTQER